MTETSLLREDIRENLLAIDRSTGKLLWKRRLSARSILRTPHLQLPFLITLSMNGNRWKGNKPSIQIEVIDAQTGQTIGRQENFLKDHILQFTYAPERGRIELRGKKSVFHLDFGGNQPRALRFAGK